MYLNNPLNKVHKIMPSRAVGEHENFLVDGAIFVFVFSWVLSKWIPQSL